MQRNMAQGFSTKYTCTSVTQGSTIGHLLQCQTRDQGLFQGVEHDTLSSFMYSNIFNQKMDHKSWHLNSSVRWYSTFFVQVLTSLAKKSISEENKTVHELLVYMMYKGLFYLQFPGQTLRIVLASPTTRHSAS